MGAPRSSRQSPAASTPRATTAGGPRPDENPISDCLRACPEGTQIAVRVQPRASRDEIGDLSSTELKIRVTAPPVDSAANEAVCRLLADRLGCRPGAVRILRGQTSRQKILVVTGLAPAEIQARWSTG